MNITHLMLYFTTCILLTSLFSFTLSLLQIRNIFLWINHFQHKILAIRHWLLCWTMVHLSQLPIHKDELRVACDRRNFLTRRNSTHKTAILCHIRFFLLLWRKAIYICIIYEWRRKRAQTALKRNGYRSYVINIVAHSPQLRNELFVCQWRHFDSY